MVGKPHCTELSVSALRTVFVNDRGSKLSSLVTKDKETTLELDSHADTSYLGGGPYFYLTMTNLSRSRGMTRPRGPGISVLSVELLLTLTHTLVCGTILLFTRLCPYRT